MPGDWKDLYRSRSDDDRFAHPDSPAGGTGTGFARPPAGAGKSLSLVPHPDSPSGTRSVNTSKWTRQQLEEDFKDALETVDEAAGTEEMVRFAAGVLAPYSFDLGVCYGIVESGAGIAAALYDLTRVFVLAGLYDVNNLGWFAGPLLGIKAEAKLAEWVFGTAALKEAHDQRGKLIDELKKAVAHPLELAGAAGKEYAVKWERFRYLMDRPTLANSFEAGKIFGHVLVDVVLLITTVTEGIRLAKLMKDIPELVKLAKSLKTVVKAGGGAAAKEEAAAGGVVRSVPKSPKPRIEPKEPPPPPEEPPIKPKEMAKSGLPADAEARLQAALNSTDPAVQMEGKVGKFLKDEGTLKDFNFPVNDAKTGLPRQIDMMAGKTNDFVVEVTTGTGKGKIGQATAQAAATGKPVVIYGENLSKGFVRIAEKQGFQVAQSLDELKAVLSGN